MTEETFEKLLAPFTELIIIDTMISADVREAEKGRDG